MKTDKLEQFIIDNRNEFDDLEPNPAIWDKIQKREPKTVELNWTKVLVGAAAVAVIFVSSYIFFDYINRQNNVSLVAETEVVDPGDAGMYEDLMEAAFYYTSQIEQRKQEFYQLTGNDAPLREEINIELDDLDKIFRELKEDLKDNADNEEVVVAMIQNYRLKLEILEEIVLQMEPAKENTKNNENEIINM